MPICSSIPLRLNVPKTNAPWLMTMYGGYWGSAPGTASRVIEGSPVLVVRPSANSLSVSLPIEVSTRRGCCFSTRWSKSLVTRPHMLATTRYCTWVPTVTCSDLGHSCFSAW